jgi:PIN domain nuclease of toxin-antitoxin system
VRLLVDTHCWLWYLLSPERLNKKAQRTLRDAGNDVFFSVASTWEIVIKFRLGKLDLPSPPSEYIPDRLERLGHQALTIRQHHVLRLEALVEDLRLMTADKVLTAYDVPVFWAGA